jgi:ribose transport system permease protein
VSIALIVGLAVGALVNGVLVGVLRLSFFIATLASMTVITGAVALWSNSASLSIDSPAINFLGYEELAGVPVPIWTMVLTFLAALYLERRTFFGRDVYASGGSAMAARLSGIRVSRTIIMVYGLSGLCAALGGVMSAGRIGSASPVVDNTLALQAAAAVLVGGTSLFGGAGSVVGTALGVLFIGELQNGLAIAGVQSFWQQIVTGVILVVAVLGGTEVQVNRTYRQVVTRLRDTLRGATANREEVRDIDEAA